MQLEAEPFAMPDPYDVLGVARGASYEEVSFAYRRAAKSRHPDMGGSREAMEEASSAYSQILKDLKRAYALRQRTPERK
jgi:DnaJ-class molecular chaperone